MDAIERVREITMAREMYRGHYAPGALQSFTSYDIHCFHAVGGWNVSIYSGNKPFTCAIFLISLFPSPPFPSLSLSPDSRTRNRTETLSEIIGCPTRPSDLAEIGGSFCMRTSKETVYNFNG